MSTASYRQNMGKQRIFHWVALAGSAVFVFMLGLYAWAGTFARYWADDYCYSGTLREYGLINGLVRWYQVSGNRFTTLIAVWVSEAFGTQAIRWIPLSVLIFLLAGWFYALTGVARLARISVHQTWIWLASLILVYFNVLLAVDRLQSLYWRMGTLHYTLPLALLLLWVGGLSRSLASPRLNPDLGWILSVGGLAFFAAGLSETFAAAQVGAVLLLAMVGVVYSGRDRWRVLRFSGPILAGSLFAMGIMAASPSNVWRMAAVAPPPGLLDLILMTVRYAFDFTFFSFRGEPIPLAAFATGIGGLAYLSVWRQSPPLGLGKAARGFFSAAIGGFAFLACVIAPSVYAGGQYPAGRAMMVGRFAFLVGWGAAAFFAAALLARIRWKALPWLVAAGLALTCFYPLRGLPGLQAEAHELQIRAVRWDTRNADILAKRTAGEVDLTVREIDVAQGQFDMGPDSSFWVNQCVADFYGVQSITANP
jgi:hypothetical protein